MREGKESIKTLDESVEISQSNYKEIWDKVNELVFVIEISKGFVPKNFIDCNNKVCSKLGYSREELIKILPSNVLNLTNIEDKISIFENLSNKRVCDKIELTLKSKDEKRIYAKSNISLFSHEEKDFALVIATDITEYKILEEEA